MKRLALLLTSGLGDMIVAMPAIKAAIRHHRPEVVDLICDQELSQIARLAGIKCQWLDARQQPFQALWDTNQTPQDIRGRHYDLLIDCWQTRARSSRLVPAIADRVFTIPAQGWDLNDLPLPAEVYYRLAGPLGYSPAQEYPLELTTGEQMPLVMAPGVELARPRLPCVCLCPCTSNPAKRMPLEAWRRLAWLIRHELCWRVCWLLGPAEVDLDEPLLKEQEDIFRELDLLAAAQLIQHCGLVVATDSGIAHLATWLTFPSGGRPKTVVCYTPETERFWKPAPTWVWPVAFYPEENWPRWYCDIETAVLEHFQQIPPTKGASDGDSDLPQVP